MASAWPRVKVSEVCESIVDCVNKTAKIVEHVTPYKMIRTTNVRDGYVNVSEVRHVDRDTYEQWTRRQVPQPGDVILTREAPLGEVGMIRTNEKIFLGQRLMSYRADESKLDKHYLLYSLMGHDLQGQIRGLGSGATVEHMRVGDAENLELPLPPLKVQHKIAAILSAYDDLIENNSRRIKVLEEMAQLIYREWFVNFRFPGHEDVPMVGSELGEIPAGWEVSRLGNVAQFKSGYAFKSSTFEDVGDYGLITIKNVHDGMFRPEGAARIDELPPKLPEYCVLHSGDILLSLTGTVGRTCLVVGEGYLLNQRVSKLVPQHEHLRSLTYLLFRAETTRTRLEQISTGVAQQNLSPVKAADLKVLLAPAELLERFESLCGAMLEEIVNLQTRNQNLRQTRDLLLPKLISGELDVSALGDEASLVEAAA